MIRNKMFFREEDTGGGDGGDPQAGDRGAAVFDTPPTAHVEVEEKVVPDKPSGGFDAAEFSKTFAETIKPMFEQRQQQQEEKPLTPEEAKKLLKVWEPDDEFIKDFGNLETQKKAFEKFRDGLLAQFDTLAQYRIQELQKQVEGKLTPAVDFISRHEAEQRETRFNKKYEVLAKPELKPLLAAVAQGLAQEGKQFKTEDEAFDGLAKAVEAVIQQSNPDFKLDSAGSSPAKPANNNRPNNGIPVTTGGSGGGGGGRRVEPAKPRGISIFDK